MAKARRLDGRTVESAYAVAVPRARWAAPMAYGGVRGIVGMQPANMVNLPPELYPPENSTGIFLSDSAALAGAGSSATPAGLTITLPGNMVGIVDALELLVDGILITTQIIYSTRVSGSPVQGFSNLTILPRNGAQSVSKSLGPFLRLQIPVGGTFQMTFFNTDGGAVTMGAQVRGWFWPAQR